MLPGRRPPFALPALQVYLVHAGVAAFAFAVMATLSSVYRFQVVGLSPLQLVLVGTVLEGTVLLAELPTGVIVGSVQTAGCRAVRGEFASRPTHGSTDGRLGFVSKC